MASPKVLIVVLNYNGEGVLEDCLDSIDENTDYPNYDLLVVDNGSEDESLEVAEKRDVDIMELQENLGFDIANNKAIYSNPDYDYYILANNDIEVAPQWLNYLVNTAEERSKAGLIGPKILNEDRTIQSAGYKSHRGGNIGKDRDEDAINGVKDVGAIHGSCMMISKDLINEIGYLDEIFSLGNSEEWDYSNRAKEAGFNIYMDSRSTIIHKEDWAKDQINDDLIYLISHKDWIKYQIMNGRLRDIALKSMKFARIFGQSLLPTSEHSTKLLLRSIKETIIDLPNVVHKRHNRAEYVHPYYCEGIKDYSARYNDLK